MMPQNPERALHIAILGYLRLALPRAAAATLIHIPNGENRSSVTGALLKRMGVVPGVEDLQFGYRGKTYCVEIKTPKGRISPAQKIRRESVENVGWHYQVIRSLNEAREFVAWLKR